MEDMNEFPHLAAFQMRMTQKAVQKRIDRELEQQFGKINGDEEEMIWKAEQARVQQNV